MEMITPNHSDYDGARSVFNAMIDRRPAVIARCATAADVAGALDHSRRHGYDVAVRAGGHSVAGMSMNDGGLVVDVRPMKDICIDPRTRSARVGAGVTWGELDRATQQHGLATTGGRASTTGVAGLTLGGGSGWLERRFGLACDNLRSVRLVTADGRQITASATENPDLFWALHGGGGNFGVATTFEFELHPVRPRVLAGLLLWPGDAAWDVVRAYRDLAYTAPDELGSALLFITGPAQEVVPTVLHGKTVVAVAVLWSGDIADGEAVIRPLRDLGPAADLVAPMAYADFQCAHDDPAGLRNYWTADYHDEFPDLALEVFVQYGFERCSAHSQLVLLPWGGAVARVPGDATPLGKRSARWVTHPFALWDDARDSDRNVAWARGFRADIAQYANGATYLNFIGNEGEDRIRAAFGEERYRRLAAVKAAWDPDNVFRGNHNIRPATALLAS
ncbi:MAG: FAD-binding oxidoreductase [Candidatus Dormibacteria bacterium]